MAAAVTVAFNYKLSARLPNLKPALVEPLRDQTIILSGPGLAAVATDLETRLSETGLSTAQVTDYRNFAHGRHTGLARRIEQTTVVALIDSRVEELAERTLSVLPEETHLVLLRSRLEWPMSVLDLLVASMNSIAPSAEAGDFDPGRPRVPRFGRRLYHLSSRRLIAPASDPVDRKLGALRVGGPHQLRKRYEKAAADWLATFRRQRFLGFVFDYDGTVCATDARYDLPSLEIREELLRLLNGGAVLGFASGRGGSIHRDLREWIPKEAWSQVELGLYNGGLSLRLDEQLEGKTGRTELIDIADRRMRSGPLASLTDMIKREYQLSISPRPSSGLTLETLAVMAQETISIPPALPLKVTASGHSVDVIPADSGKTRTLERVAGGMLTEVVAFGDQGQVGGNDFELLAATPWSLSVDRVSGDPTRCWNLDARGERGPELLRRYLRHFRHLRDGFAFRSASR